MKHNDHRYVEALVNNDSVLIESIYQDQSQSIMQLILSHHGTMDDAKDVFQDALIKLRRQGMNGFVLTCPINAFLKRACLALWLDELKKRHRSEVTKTEYSRFEGNVEAAVKDFLQAEQRMELFYSKLKLLGTSCQDILHLSLQENENGKKKYNLSEIAAILGISYDYIRRRIGECSAQLAQLIKDDPEFPTLKV